MVSHDQHYKNMILDYPREAIAFFAPEEAQALDQDVKITPVRQEQLQERLGERFRELDVPLLVEWPDGRREALLFVLEEESDPHRFSILRLAHYCLDIAELMDTRRVVPVVIFLRSAASLQQHLRLGGDHAEYLSFHYLACHLDQLPATQFLDSDNLVARLNLPQMDPAGTDKVVRYAYAIRALLTMEPDMDKRLKYVDFVDLYAKLDENERLQWERAYPMEKQQVETTSERARRLGREEALKQIEVTSERARRLGREEGLQQGLSQGLLDGERELIRRQLVKRFGALPRAVTLRLERADAPELEQWAEQLLEAASLEAIFGPLH